MGGLLILLKKGYIIRNVDSSFYRTTVFLRKQAALYRILHSLLFQNKILHVQVVRHPMMKFLQYAILALNILD